MRTKRFFANHSKSSAMVVSLAIHAVLAVGALSFVAVRVITKEEPAFEAKHVKRPKMPLKKIQVPVDVKKRKPKPRLRKRIVSTKKTFADIKMPEITGVAGGLGNMGGDGLGSLGFDFKMDLFGSDRPRGNELVGTFYDLKLTKDKKPTGMNDAAYFAVVKKFSSTFNENRMDDYFVAPKNKYANFLFFPRMSASSAPEAFRVADVVQPRYWVAHYKGQFSAPEDGRYRFCGIADDVLIVRVNKRHVLDASWEIYRDKGLSSKWKPTDKQRTQFGLEQKHIILGDWIRMKKGVLMNIDVLLGECPGGSFSCQLLIEKEGEDYEMFEGNPVRPLFKTAPVPKDLIPQMKVNSQRVTLEGTTFGTIRDN